MLGRGVRRGSEFEHVQRGSLYSEVLCLGAFLYTGVPCRGGGVGSCTVRSDLMFLGDWGWARGEAQYIMGNDHVGPPPCDQNDRHD